MRQSNLLVCLSQQSNLFTMSWSFWIVCNLRRSRQIEAGDHLEIIRGDWDLREITGEPSHLDRKESWIRESLVDHLVADLLDWQTGGGPEEQWQALFRSKACEEQREEWEEREKLGVLSRDLVSLCGNSEDATVQQTCSYGTWPI